MREVQKALGFWSYDFVILGEPASAKNQRRIVTLGGSKSPRLIKSKKALAYCEAFEAQCPVAADPLGGDIAIWVDVYYASRRPDLSCLDIIMDCLQGKMYQNDRQIKAECALWNLDRSNPRVRIRLREINSKGSTEMSSLEPSEIWGWEIG